MKRERIGTVIEVVAVGPAVFALAGPSVFTVRQFAHDEGARRDIRFAQVFGTIFTLALGVGVSLTLEEEDWTPFYASAGVSLALVGMYEYALRNPRTGTDIVTGKASGENSTGGFTF